MKKRMTLRFRKDEDQDKEGDSQKEAKGPVLEIRNGRGYRVDRLLSSPVPIFGTFDVTFKILYFGGLLQSTKYIRQAVKTLMRENLGNLPNREGGGQEFYRTISK